MAKRKKNKKKNKRDEEILLDITEVTGQAEDYFEKNQKPIMIGAILFVLVVVTGVEMERYKANSSEVLCIASVLVFKSKEAPNCTPKQFQHH